ncbi:unnamed protein product [Brassica oleracea]
MASMVGRLTSPLAVPRQDFSQSYIRVVALDLTHGNC